MFSSASLRYCRQLCLSRLARLRTPTRRNASTGTNPYPYPTTANPSPSQIFHLPQSASRDEVKARYYELVRIYHPDAPSSRAVSPETAHTRFQAISAAYAVLSGKSCGSAGADGPARTSRSDAHNLSAAMWRARQRRRAELDIGRLDERWKDAMMLGAVVLSLVAFVLQAYSTRRQAMADAADRARQYSSRPEDLRRRAGKNNDAALAAQAVEGLPRC